MKIHIPKAYLLIGIVLTAGIVISSIYNIVSSNSRIRKEANKEINIEILEETENKEKDENKNKEESDTKEKKSGEKTENVQLEDLQSRITSIEEQSKSKDVRIETLQNTINMLQSEIRELRNSTDKARIKELEEENASLKKQLEELLSTKQEEKNNEGKIRAGRVIIKVNSLIQGLSLEEQAKDINLRVAIEEKTIYEDMVSKDTQSMSLNIEGMGVVSIKIYMNGNLNKQTKLDLNKENPTWIAE